ncbi:DUF5629 family protein [Pseudomonas sp. RIT-PI-S]|uniref:DUF5629 family protein n=1 Tax=Pseudomonas sp. RIT-PI-S TaxID=3035295 RepID=UPI0021DA6ECE|nr:DUF5629 family protein [Pseudomonas sp. RIT-PI-S]
MTQPLAEALDATDMVIIDDLYAFEFALGSDGLTIVCMDGRDERQWRFSPEQVAAARFVSESDLWEIQGSDAVHRLRLLEAFAADDDDDQA